MFHRVTIEFTLSKENCYVKYAESDEKRGTALIKRNDKKQEVKYEYQQYEYIFSLSNSGEDYTPCLRNQ